jgi:hypothetical protein
MVLRARQKRYRWMMHAGVALFPLSIILALAAVLASAFEKQAGASILVIAIALLGLAGVSGVLALGLPLWTFFSCRNYDPNSHSQRSVPAPEGVVQSHDPWSTSEERIIVAPLSDSRVKSPFVAMEDLPRREIVTSPDGTRWKWVGSLLLPESTEIPDAGGGKSDNRTN